EGLDLIGLAVANGQHDDGNLRLLADGPARLDAAHARHVHVEQHEIEARFTKPLQRRLPALHIVHLESMSGQRDAHHAPDLWIVVDHQYPARAHDVPRGNESVNAVPASAELSRLKRPPCACTIWRTIDSPIPVPGICRA